MLLPHSAVNVCQRCLLSRLKIFPFKGNNSYFAVRPSLFPATTKWIIRQFSSKSGAQPFSKIQPIRTTYKLIYHNYQHHQYTYLQVATCVLIIAIGSTGIYMTLLPPSDRREFAPRWEALSPRPVDKIIVCVFLGVLSVLMLTMTTALRKWMVIKIYENTAENGKYVAIMKDLFYRDYRLAFTSEDVSKPKVDFLHFWRIVASILVQNESNRTSQFLTVSQEYFDVPASYERLTKGNRDAQSYDEFYRKFKKYPDSKTKQQLSNYFFKPPGEEFVEFEEKDKCEKKQEKIKQEKK